MENEVMHRYVYIRVDSSIIHNSWKTAVTQLSNHSWIGEQNVVCPFSGVVYSLKKEHNSDTRDKWKNPEDITLREISQSKRSNVVDSANMRP